MSFTIPSPFIVEMCFILGLCDARVVIDFLGRSAGEENSVSIFAFEFPLLHLMFHIWNFLNKINDHPQTFNEHTVEDRLDQCYRNVSRRTVPFDT